MKVYKFSEKPIFSKTRLLPTCITIQIYVLLNIQVHSKESEGKFHAKAFRLGWFPKLMSRD